MDEWLSSRDVAARLGVATHTVARFVQRGELPAYQIGRLRRYKAADVESFIESCRIEPGTVGST